MAWLTVDKSSIECIFDNEPVRIDGQWDDVDYMVRGETNYDSSTGIILPKGTIKKLIGKDLTWKDEPVKIK